MANEAKNEVLNALVLTAMMQALDQEKRDELFKKALATLIAPQASSGRYGETPKPSHLEEAFNSAVQTMATKIIKEMIESNDAIRKQVQSLCSEAVRKAFANSDELSTRMANAFTVTLLKDRY